MKLLGSLSRDELKRICGDNFPQWISFPVFEQVFLWWHIQVPCIFKFVYSLDHFRHADDFKNVAIFLTYLFAITWLLTINLNDLWSYLLFFLSENWSGGFSQLIYYSISSDQYFDCICFFILDSFTKWAEPELLIRARSLCNFMCKILVLFTWLLFPWSVQVKWMNKILGKMWPFIADVSCYQFIIIVL